MAAARRPTKLEALRCACAVAVLAASVLATWRLTLVERPQLGGAAFHAADLFVEHYPTVTYSSRELGAWRLPLWNPYQLCGMPFLAVPHTALFYPPNLLYLAFDAGTGTEVQLVLHWFVAGVGLLLLCHTLGMGWTAAVAGATTFMLSGWLLHNIPWPAIVATMAWLPWTVLCIERTFAGGRWAPFGLVAVVALQTLTGAFEYVLFNSLVCGLYVCVRGAHLAIGDGARRLLAPLIVMMLAAVAGVAVTAVQLVPSLELTALSGRATEPMTLDQARFGAVPATQLLQELLGVTGDAAVGVLPLLGLPLLFGYRRYRWLWLFAAALAIAGATLAVGGRAFELYHATPLGQIFRRPAKFLFLHAFGQSLLAAGAITALTHWRDTARRQMVREAAWPASLVAAGAVLSWNLAHAQPVALVATALLLATAYGLVPTGRWRSAVCVGLCVLHGASLIGLPRSPVRRLAQRPDLYEKQAGFLHSLSEYAGQSRLYLSSAFSFDHALAQRQGLIQRLAIVGDYEALAMERQAEFFARASGRPFPSGKFAGSYSLGDRTRWKLMDMTSTRVFVLRPEEDADVTLAALAADSARTGVRWLAGVRPIAYERTTALPRAYFVAGARVLAEPSQVLATIASDGFDPHREVVIESPPVALAPRPADARSEQAQVIVRRLDPEDLRIEVHTPVTGFLVLTDTYYPGWEAFRDGEPAPILRANYLFRAVPIDVGSTVVDMRYRPRSLRIGAWISAGSVLALVVAALFVARACRAPRRRTRLH